MKSAIPFLRLKDVLSTSVVEVINEREYVVSVDGDLVRVKNATPVAFQAGDRLLLRVVSLDPLGFQLVDGFSAHLDRLA